MNDLALLFVGVALLVNAVGFLSAKDTEERAERVSSQLEQCRVDLAKKTDQYERCNDNTVNGIWVELDGDG